MRSTFNSRHPPHFRNSPQVWTSNKERHQLTSCTSDVKSLAKEYCRSSTIQGVRYLVLDFKHPIERVFWVIALLLCLSGGSLMIYKIKEKLDISPVIVSFAETSAKVWEVPFPAVTICPHTKSRQTVFNFTKHFKDFLNHKADDLSTTGNNSTVSKDAFEKVETLSLVCANYVYDPWVYELEWKSYSSDDSLKFLMEVTGKLEDGMDGYCSWNCNDSCCTKIFAKVWSEEGLCYTFNNINDHHLYRDHVINNHIFGYDQSEVNIDWDPDNGYDSNAGLSTNPWRATGSGNIFNQGLYLYLSENKSDIDYVCQSSFTGYQIILHSPTDMPLKKTSTVIDIPFDKRVAIFVKPALMFTSPDLQRYDPQIRQCYYSHEKYLHNFKFYTKNNCEIDCLVNATLKQCGCLPFYLPRRKSIKICGAGKRFCVIDAANQLHKEVIELDLQQRAAGKSSRSAVSKCDCLPSCLSIEYSADVTVSNLDTTKSMAGVDSTLGEQYKKKFSSSMDITVKNSDFMPIRRSELYGRIDFLANCGGILGLFSGFSIISAIEIIYYLTLRLWSTLRRRLRQQDVYA